MRKQRLRKARVTLCNNQDRFSYAAGTNSSEIITQQCTSCSQGLAGDLLHEGHSVTQMDQGSAHRNSGLLRLLQATQLEGGILVLLCFGVTLSN